MLDIWFDEFGLEYSTCMKEIIYEDGCISAVESQAVVLRR